MPFRASVLILSVLVLVAPAARAQSFGSLDSNRDGVLTFQETKRRFPQLQEVIFLKADRNGDGAIGSREFPAFQSVYRQVYIAH